MVTQTQLSEHLAYVEKARQIAGSFSIKPLWAWVFYGATATTTIEGYTISLSENRTEQVFSITFPTGGGNLLQKLEEAGVWEPSVIDITITNVSGSAAFLAPVGKKDLTWNQSGSDTKMSAIAIGDYSQAEIQLNQSQSQMTTKNFNSILAKSNLAISTVVKYVLGETTWADESLYVNEDKYALVANCDPSLPAYFALIATGVSELGAVSDTLFDLKLKAGGSLTIFVPAGYDLIVVRTASGGAVAATYFGVSA